MIAVLKIWISPITHLEIELAEEGFDQRFFQLIVFIVLPKVEHIDYFASWIYLLVDAG